MEKKLKK